jgi:hypothetical protein
MTSSYRYCTVPESAHVIAGLLGLLIQNSPRFRTGSTALRRGKRLADELSKIKAGDSWKLAREDWVELRDELREPHGGQFPPAFVKPKNGGEAQPIHFTWEWLPLCDMIEDATDEPVAAPAEKAEAAE